MFLSMTIGAILIDRQFISFDDLETLEDREIYLRRMVDNLYKKHIFKIIHIAPEPEFFIDHVPSKMNHNETIKRSIKNA